MESWLLLCIKCPIDLDILDCISFLQSGTLGCLGYQSLQPHEKLYFLVYPSQRGHIHVSPPGTSPWLNSRSCDKPDVMVIYPIDLDILDCTSSLQSGTSGCLGYLTMQPHGVNVSSVILPRGVTSICMLFSPPGTSPWLDSLSFHKPDVMEIYPFDLDILDFTSFLQCEMPAEYVSSKVFISMYRLLTILLRWLLLT